MSNKKKKTTPRDLAKKQERKEQEERQKKRGRNYSLIAVTVGCLGSAFMWPRENMVSYVALCAVSGLVWGFAFDVIYAIYIRKKAGIKKKEK